MTKLFILFLMKGPNWSADSTPELKKLQIEHVEYQISLRKSGKILLVGPLVDNGVYRGVTIFNAGSMEEVQRLIDEDPAVRADVFGYEIHPWMVEKEALKNAL